MDGKVSDNKNTDNEVLKKYAEIVQSEKLPPPRFGHTVNLVSKTSIVIFGGAISTPDNHASYTMTADLYLYEMTTNQWKKLETSSTTKPPHVRAAHASATVRDYQVLYYGGSIGNGQYATDDLWFLDIKNQEEANWMQVPIEGRTPGPRYGHSMVYVSPVLVLFGGSSNNSQNQKNVIMKDVWIFHTDKAPFKWISLDTESSFILSARLYHTSCVYQKYNGESDALVLFGGRDSQNVSLKDLCLLVKKKDNGKEYYQWLYTQSNNNQTNSNGTVSPISRHQHSATMFGPFLFIIGGRSSHATRTTFDVFSFVSRNWHRFGTIGLFRHTIWVYFNDSKPDNMELYLYIYGGFDSERNPEINSKLYRINIFDLFSKDDVLKEELDEYINALGRKINYQNNGKNKHFELSHKVVVYNIPEEDNFGKLVKEISYSKLTEVDKKITEKPNEVEVKQNDYNEKIVMEFLQLLPNPDAEITNYRKNDEIITLDKEYIHKLIEDCKKQLKNDSPVINLKSPVKIFGSINGQYNDLVRYFSLFGRPSELKGDIECVDYLFLGNFTNRGAFSLETFCLLLALKIKYNGHFHILRGNQEDIEISKFYGLGDECKEKLKENINEPNSIFQQICNLFEYFPLVAIINNQIACVHSGFGINSMNLNDVRKQKYPINVKKNVIAKEILWNTPVCINEENPTIKNFTSSYREENYTSKMIGEFLKTNKLKLIIRSHDVCECGMNKSFGDRVITIFSSTNYCGTFQNNGALLFIKKSYEIQPKILTCEENVDVWYNNWSTTDYPPSPKRSYPK